MAENKQEIRLLVPAALMVVIALASMAGIPFLLEALLLLPVAFAVLLLLLPLCVVFIPLCARRIADPLAVDLLPLLFCVLCVPLFFPVSSSSMTSFFLFLPVLFFAAIFISSVPVILYILFCFP